ncbi:hypothetical protein [Acuticoccus sp.]|uniref:hypothetical protein n=1 Tax=Acuticoccus sp. TaxID=1904378 RepID=UPI003B5187F1
MTKSLTAALVAGAMLVAVPAAQAQVSVQFGNAPETTRGEERGERIEDRGADRAERAADRGDYRRAAQIERRTERRADRVEERDQRPAAGTDTGLTIRLD